MMKNAKKDRIRLSHIEEKFSVKLDYFDQISFVVDEYVKDRYVKKNENEYVQIHLKEKSRNKTNKTINENRNFNSIKNKLSEFWSNGYEIDIDKTYVYGNKFKELYIIFT